MTFQKEINSLKLFNEKAEKLKCLSFSKQLSGSRLKIKWEKGKGFSTEREGPEGESIDSFILTYRYFIQNNESTSFGNLEEIYNSLPITDELKQKFKEARKKLNNFLDKETNIIINGETLINRKIQEVFIYGGYAHANPIKKQIFDEWMAKMPINSILENEFIFVSAIGLNFILYVKELNEKVFSDLKEE